ncbi:MAG TPA: GNAT family N-acetyltransferase [Thermoanaerobaculia bacterium]|nr:GNAT family N-acetyltransferase [Thermoanaerobaculia bacterium]
MTTTATYPAHFESDVVLRNGRTLHIRPVKPEDEPEMLEFYRGLSKDSLYMRFFDVRSPESALRDSPTSVDYASDFGVVGELGGAIAGIAHYFRSRRDPHVAEVAFAITDKFHGFGIGTHLLQKLADIGRTQDIDEFRAETLPENRKMLDVFLLSGFDVKSRSSDGAVHVSFPIAETELFQDKAAERSRKAAYASMKAVFEPHSIAVIGASRRAGQIGYEIVHNLRNTGFRGSLFAVNPNATEIDGVPCFPSVAAIKDPVDLGIISVPAPQVEGVIDDCITKGVGAVVVITAGFGETGAAGREAERRLVDKVRAAGIRMVGPNCLGVINADPNVNMHATFSSIFPPVGNVAMSSQSGALGIAILDYALMLNIGFSTFVSVGNKADVSGNDLIQYWAEDPNTDVMLLYLESFGNPKKFGEIARRVAKRKPIAVVKAGRSVAGARAATSHTGALATSDAIVDDLFKQAGIIRTNTLEELFDVASLLANQPRPLGRRVAIVTNAGGPGILAADSAEAAGLELAQLTEETTKQLRSYLPAAAAVGNPVDMIASASADHYKRTIRLLLEDPNVDTLMVLYIPVFATDADAVSAVIRECGQETHGKTMLATFMSAQRKPAGLMPVPSFPFPERAVAALARATAYAEWRRRPVGTRIRYEDIDRPQMRMIVDRNLAAGGGWLDALDVQSLLLAMNIPGALIDKVESVYDAVQVSMRMGFPVVLKALGPTLLHKTESGAVKLGLQDEREVREAYVELQGRLGERMTGAIVQQMITGGVEVMVGAMEDPTFGHVVVYGAGGTLVELLADISFRIHPLTDIDADDMVDEVRFSRMLHGFRGSKPADIVALKDIMLRTSALLEICPEIRELDINPLKVLEQGALVVDARIRVEAMKPAPPSRRIAY